LVECERREGVRGVPSNAWQLAHSGDFVWKMAAISIHDDSGGGEKISGPRVVAKSLPGL